MVSASANDPENNLQPEQLVSENGKLDVTLTVDLVSSLDGNRLAPGYNGKPMGPTLRVKPGDTLTVTLTNNLDPSSDYDKELLNYVQDPNSDENNATVVSSDYSICTLSDAFFIALIHICFFQTVSSTKIVFINFITDLQSFNS